MKINWSKDYNFEFICPHCDTQGLHLAGKDNYTNRKLFRCPKCRKRISQCVNIKFPNTNTGINWNNDYKIGEFACPNPDCDSRDIRAINSAGGKQRFRCNVCGTRTLTELDSNYRKLIQREHPDVSSFPKTIAIERFSYVRSLYRITREHWSVLKPTAVISKEVFEAGIKHQQLKLNKSGMQESEFLLTKILKRLGSTAPIGISTFSAIVESDIVLCMVKADSLAHKDFDANYEYCNDTHKIFIRYDPEKVLDDYCSILVHEMTHWGQAVDRDFNLSIDNKEEFVDQYLVNLEMPAYYTQALYEAELSQQNRFLSHSKYSEKYLRALAKSNEVFKNQQENFSNLCDGIEQQSVGKSIADYAKSIYDSLIDQVKTNPDFTWAHIADNIPTRNNLNITPSVNIDKNGHTVDCVSGAYYAEILKSF